MRLVLFEPDIPQNTGTLMRLAAALGVAMDLIEPCGFVLDDRRLRRAGMDYLDHLSLTRHSSWSAYRSSQPAGRLILLTTKGATPYTRFAFANDDRIMVGRESSGVPEDVAATADAGVVIPMRPAARSLNVAIAAAMVLGEALRQTSESESEECLGVRSGRVPCPNKENPANFRAESSAGTIDHFPEVRTRSAETVD